MLQQHIGSTSSKIGRTNRRVINSQKDKNVPPPPTPPLVEEIKVKKERKKKVVQRPAESMVIKQEKTTGQQQVVSIFDLDDDDEFTFNPITNHLEEKVAPVVDIFALEDDVDSTETPSPTHELQDDVDEVVPRVPMNNNDILTLLAHENEKIEQHKSTITRPMPQTVEEVNATEQYQRFMHDMNPPSLPSSSSSSDPPRFPDQKAEDPFDAYLGLGETHDFARFMQLVGGCEDQNISMLGSSLPSQGGIYAPRTSTTRRSFTTGNVNPAANNQADHTVPPWSFTLPIARILEFVALQKRHFDATISPEVKNSLAPLEQTALPCPAKHMAQMLTQPYGFFRPCIWGESCVANTEWGFICREYMSPPDLKISLERNSVVSFTHTMCALCWMMLVNIMYNVNRSLGANCDTIRLPFYFEVDKAGEYDSLYMLPVHTAYTNKPLDAILTGRGGAENCYGLTAPFRTLVVSDFILQTMTVKVPDDTRVRTINCLQEQPRLFFLRYNESHRRIPQIDPIKYAWPIFNAIPSTSHILTSFFSFSNQLHVIGTLRLLAFGIKMTEKASTEHATVPLFQYWCMASKGQFQKCKIIPPRHFEHEPFLWDMVFNANIAVMANNLPSFLRSGRIDIKILLTQNHFADTMVSLRTPLSYYEEQFSSDPRFAEQRVYLAMCLRICIVRTLLKIYPKSKNSEKDPIVHRHLENFLRWHEEHHMLCINENTKDNDPIMPELLKHLSQVPIPLHIYACNDSFLKYTMEIRSHKSPAFLLAIEYPQHAVYFSEFKRHVAMIRTNQQPYNPAEEFVHFKPPKDIQHVFSIPCHEYYSIMIAVLQRVNMALRLYHEQDPKVTELYARYRKMNESVGEHDFIALATVKRELNKVRKLRYTIKTFLYSHLALSVRIFGLKLYTDLQIESRVKRKNKNYRLTHLVEAYPYPCTSVYEGTLPNFSTVITAVPFLEPSSSDNRTSNQPPNRTFKMFSKLLPRTYQMRSHTSKHFNLCESMTAYRHFTMLVLRVMLLGNYIHSDTVPPFDVAIHFYQLFTTHYTKESFMEWHKQHASIIILAMREFLCRTIEMNLPYESYVIKNYPFWVKFKRRVYEASDIVRMMLNRRTPPPTIDTLVKIIFKGSSSSPNSNVLRDPFIVGLFREVPDIIKLQFENIVPKEPLVKRVSIDPVRAICRQLNVLNHERSRMGYVRPEQMPRPLHRMLLAKAESIKPHTPIDLRWFNEFNLDEEKPLISDRTIRILEYVFYFIIQGTQQALDCVMLGLQTIPPLEYEIVDAFFNMLLTQYSINVLYLPRTELKRQIEALRKRYGITNEDPNTLFHSPYTFCMLYTSCCGVKKSYDTQNNSPFAFGANNVAINPITNQLVCRTKNQTLERKEARVKGMLMTRLRSSVITDNSRMMLSTVKRIDRLADKQNQLRYYAQPECGSVPVIAIPMIGRVIQLTELRIPKSSDNPITNAFVFCSNCGGISAFSTKLYGPNGIECTACDLCHILARYTPSCVTCTQKIKFKAPNHSFMVIDDTPDIGDYSIKRMYICDRCYKTQTSNWDPQHIFTVTDLKACKHHREDGMEYKRAIRNGDTLDTKEFTEGSNHKKRRIHIRQSKYRR